HRRKCIEPAPANSCENSCRSAAKQKIASLHGWELNHNRVTETSVPTNCHPEARSLREEPYEAFRTSNALGIHLSQDPIQNATALFFPRRPRFSPQKHRADSKL